MSFLGTPQVQFPQCAIMLTDRMMDDDDIVDINSRMKDNHNKVFGQYLELLIFQSGYKERQAVNHKYCPEK